MDAQALNLRHSDRILKWLRTRPGGATKREIGRAIRIGYKPISEAISFLLERKSIERCGVLVINGGTYNGYCVTQISLQYHHWTA